MILNWTFDLTMTFLGPNLTFIGHTLFVGTYNSIVHLIQMYSQVLVPVVVWSSRTCDVKWPLVTLENRPQHKKYTGSKILPQYSISENLTTQSDVLYWKTFNFGTKKEHLSWTSLFFSKNKYDGHRWGEVSRKSIEQFLRYDPGQTHALKHACTHAQSWF